jgi:hypothetical protein
MTEDLLHIINGILLIVFCGLTIYVGLTIASRYFKYHQRDILCVGLAWIGLSSAWYPACISFIFVYILGLNRLPAQAYFFIGIILYPLFLNLWIVAVTDLFNPKRKKLIITLYAIYNAAFLIAFLYFLFIDPSKIGELRGPTDVLYKDFVQIYLFIAVVTFLVIGLFLSYYSFKSETPEIKLKGKLLLVAFISTTVGAAFDTSLPLTFITLPLFRSLEIIGSIAFYGGYIMPVWMKRLFFRKIE